MGRYSIPTCQKKLQLSDYCRPASDEPTNTTITYFDGQVVSLYNVHMIMCPCADGLSCDLKTGSCVNFDGESNFNALDVNVFSEDWMPKCDIFSLIQKLSSSYLSHLFQFSLLCTSWVFSVYVSDVLFQICISKLHSVFVKKLPNIFKNNFTVGMYSIFFLILLSLYKDIFSADFKQ